MAVLTVLCAPAAAMAQRGDARELAELDVAATSLGTLQSWINTEPEAARHAMVHGENLKKYATKKLQEYATGGPGRIGDRVKAMQYGLRHWDETMKRYLEKEPKQIQTELGRQKKAVERYRKSKYSKPSSFAYIPKAVSNTKNRLDVLTAAGVDTKELRRKQEEVQTLVVDLLKSMDQEALAKANRPPRDRYKRDDRKAIEQFVRAEWKKSHGDKLPLERVVIETQSWSHTYAATFNNGKIAPWEIERMTVYVVTRKSDTISTMHPFRIMREHYRANGKVVGKIGPGPMKRLATNDLPIDVLSSKIR